MSEVRGDKHKKKIRKMIENWIRSMKQIKSMGGMIDMTEASSINEASGICELKRRHENRSIKHEST